MVKIERTKNSKRNIISGIALKLYQAAALFLIRTVIIYYMGMQYMGLNNLFASILQILNLTELGIGSAMVFSMYKPIADNDSVTICALMKLYKVYYHVIGCVVAVIGIAITPLIPNLIHGEVPEDVDVQILYLLNLGATILSYWLFAYRNSILQAYQRQDVINKVFFVSNTVQYVFQIVVIVVFKDYYLYILIMLLSQALNNILTAVAAQKCYPEYRPFGKLAKEDVSKINRRIKALFTAKFGSVIVSSVDAIVISAFLGLRVLAVYQNYYFILNAVSGFILVFFNAVKAGIGNSLVTESGEKNYVDLKKFTFIICWILCTCVCCFSAMYQPFITIWVGKTNLLSYDLVILFCVYFYVCNLTLVWATVKDAAGLWYADRFRPLISSLANLFMNLILVNYWGLYGILLSTVISYLFIAVPWLIHNVFTLLYKKNVKQYLFKLVKYIFVCILSVCLTVFLSNGLHGSELKKLLAGAAISLLISTTVQLIFYFKDEEFKLSKQLVIRLLKNN